jgi:hypothetical protein
MPDDDEIVPGPIENRVIRAGKLMGAVTGILVAVAAVVSGIWQVGSMVSDLKDTKTDLESLKKSFNDYQIEARKENEIQKEILVNLRIAVASIQTVNGYQTSGHSTMASMPPISASRIRQVLPRTLGPLDDNPEFASLIRSLPPLPPDPTTSAVGNMDSSDVIQHESDTADVALQRAEILQGSLQ